VTSIPAQKALPAPVSRIRAGFRPGAGFQRVGKAVAQGQRQRVALRGPVQGQHDDVPALLAEHELLEFSHP
jgi:hypothetical protein